MIEVWLYDSVNKVDSLLNQEEAIIRFGEPRKKMLLVEYQKWVASFGLRGYPLFVSIGVSLNQVEEAEKLLLSKCYHLVKDMTVKVGWFKKRPATEAEKQYKLFRLLVTGYVGEYTRLYDSLTKMYVAVGNGKFVNQNKLIDILTQIELINN